VIKYKLCIYDDSGKILAEKEFILRTKFNYRIDRGFKELLETFDVTPYSGQSLLGHLKYFTPYNDVFFVSSFKIKLSDDKSVSIERMREITQIK
jgi:hypothetical protein